MRLPRRVPWASISELEQVCSWIYTDENDSESTLRAINRLSAWKAITSLPHALESVLSILSVIYQDKSQDAPSFQLSLRQSYSTAIIRLVNGLVDPLQLGAYARSIASIASQIGLPLWLVELRHAATHEDLPSLELLREAARESMAWLLNNYFLPTIYPHTSQTSQPALRTLQPILKQYKGLMKTTIRDVSLKSQYKQNIFQVMKEVERWIAEARVAANVVLRQLNGEVNSQPLSLDLRDMDPQERWALERFCDEMLEKGALVPLSKRKRDFPTDSFLPPQFSIQLWEPLLQHLQNLHFEFLGVLASRLISALDVPTEVDEKSQPDASYDMCLARWLMWSIRASEAGELHGNVELRKDVTAALMQSLGHSAGSSRRRKAAVALLDVLCAESPQLDALLAALKKMSTNVSFNNWVADDIAVMDQRLQTLLSRAPASDSVHSPSYPQEPPSIAVGEAPPGWRLLDEKSGWRPCPIGVHCETK